MLEQIREDLRSEEMRKLDKYNDDTWENYWTQVGEDYDYKNNKKQNNWKKEQRRIDREGDDYNGKKH